MVLGVSGWPGVPGPYAAIVPGSAGGGGFCYSWGNQGTVAAIVPGSAGGGGRVQSSAAPLAGYGGCSGPGPGAMIGIEGEG